ncbi:hypothetical protein [Hymenobacter sublimis]|uniref:Uncharacterized protein n=1 Tax=Hymenobacter sublimis TaxID=2933777 RepID=A0ABY4J7N8_9BACT|nr:hypothetical protein [Hymenobacter sublimis]UPL48834.1 hypothetical protein MWH26_16810 [Hymenobacter sublimis]
MVAKPEVPVGTASPPAAKVARLSLPVGPDWRSSARSRNKQPRPAAKRRPASAATSHTRTDAAQHRQQPKPSFHYRSPRELHFGPNAGTFLLLVVGGVIGLIVGAFIGSTAGIMVAVAGLAAVVLGFLGFVNQW